MTLWVAASDYLSIRYKDREDRATTDQVLDTATRLIILKVSTSEIFGW